MINFKHKELTPLCLSYEDKLSVDPHYGSWTQGGLYEDYLDSNFTDDEYEEYNNYTSDIFSSTQQNLNLFKGNIQWDVLIAMYIVFQINKIYWEVIESKDSNQMFTGKMNILNRSEISTFISIILNLKKYKDQKSYIFSYWLLEPEAFSFPEKRKDSKMANLASDFIFDFMERVYDSEYKNQIDLLQKHYPSNQTIAFPDKESMKNYLNLWKNAFEECLEYFEDNDPTLVQFYEDEHILELNNKFFKIPQNILDNDIFYVAENLQWNDLVSSNYSQSEIDKLFSKRFFRKGNEKFYK